MAAAYNARMDDLTLGAIVFLIAAVPASLLLLPILDLTRVPGRPRRWSSSSGRCPEAASAGWNRPSGAGIARFLARALYGTASKRETIGPVNGAGG